MERSLDHAGIDYCKHNEGTKVREIQHRISPRITHWQLNAISCLQEAVEAYLIRYLEDCNEAAVFAHRVTIMQKDVQFFGRLRGKNGGIFAQFVHQGVGHAAGNLTCESRQASVPSARNASQPRANLPVSSTVKPAGEVLRQTAERTRPFLPPPANNAVEMQRVQGQLNEAMGSGVVKTAVEMGFERRVIRRLIKRRLQSRNEMYGSVENLIEDHTRSPPSDSDENGGTTMAISCVPANVKRPAEAQSNQQSNEPAGENVPAVKTGNEGRQDTAPANEEPMCAEMSMPEDVIQSMEAQIRELQKARKCKICLDLQADSLT
ncbi:uncharacterized protein LOC143463095 isoform X2 [Clavelina lepadiformis]|uniref:uncharacterized protein LOC143463095 isoform X2 n=1 Tax=Clavelina lepadiformis TaxID=159417 RepID=UPI004043431B